MLNPHFFFCAEYPPRKSVHSAFTCSKLTTETLEQDVKYVTCSKLTIKIPERRHWSSSVSVVNFEQVHAGWGTI